MRSAPARLELAAWCLAAAVAIATYHAAAGHVLVSNDGYQYLSAASNIAEGNGISTSLVHFDSERAHGTIPAPLTTFPPGLPLLLAPLRLAGIAGPLAGLLVSALATIALLPIFAWAARRAGVDPPITRIALLLLVLSARRLAYANAVLSEPPFTVLAFAALALAAFGRRDRVLLAAGLCAGLAFSVRYAGLFLIVTLCAWALARRRRLLLAALPALPLVAVVLARNVLVSGTWRGGNTKPAAHALGAILAELGRSALRLPFAVENYPLPYILPSAIAVAGAWAAAVLAGRRGPRRAALGLPAAYAAVYVAAMCYVGATSVISFGPRMFAPLYPVLLLLVAAAASRLPPTRARAIALAITVVAFAATNVPAAVLYTGVRGPHVAAARRLGTLRAWILSHAPPATPLVSVDGQAVGYLLGRPVVSLVEPEYSDVVWDGATIRATMKRFGAKLLILDAATPPPPGLELAAANGALAIYRRPTKGTSR